MKKIILISFALVTLLFTGAAQVSRSCASHEVYNERNKDPEVYARRKAIDEHTSNYIASRGKSARSNVFKIKVIVHVLYKTAQENISDAQIKSQIKVLNEDFRKLNSDVKKLPAEFNAADAKIEFVLDRINRKKTNRSVWYANDDMKKASQGGVNNIQPEKYLNIWVCNLGDYLGYAEFPGGPKNLDGIVIATSSFGSSSHDKNFYLYAPFDKGRTLTHEIGHYLNLRHIWGDGGCGMDDFVRDTPKAGDANFGCPTYPSKSCANNGGWNSDMFMNFMDYTDDKCMYAFTAGQSARMDAVLVKGGARSGLVNSEGGTNPLAGTFRFKNVATQTYMDAEPRGVIKVAAKNTKLDQKWRLVKSSKGYFNIDNASKNRGILNTEQKGIVKYIAQNPTSKDSDKEWKVIHIQGKYYRFQNRKSGRDYLSVNRTTKIVGYSSAKNNTTKWELIKVSGNKSSERKSALEGEGSLTVYPNPTTGVFTINTKGMQSVNISIYNLSGKLVYQLTNDNNSQIELDMKTISDAGLYIIKAVDGEGRIYTEKLLVD